MRLLSFEVQPVCIPMNLACRVQDRTLLWVNFMLALLEDVPMLSLTFAYVLRLQGTHESCVTPVFIVSMMMSAGAVYLKFGGLIYFPLLDDQKKHLEDRIARKAVNWLTAEDRSTLEQHGIRIRCSTDNNAGSDLNRTCPRLDTALSLMCFVAKVRSSSRASRRAASTRRPPSSWQHVTSRRCFLLVLSLSLWRIWKRNH